MASTDYPLMQYAYFNRFWITDVAIGQGETTRESSVYSNTVSGFCFLGGGDGEPPSPCKYYSSNFQAFRDVNILNNTSVCAKLSLWAAFNQFHAEWRKIAKLCIKRRFSPSYFAVSTGILIHCFFLLLSVIMYVIFWQHSWGKFDVDLH